jgi:hypothetical protein
MTPPINLYTQYTEILHNLNLLEIEYGKLSKEQAGAASFEELNTKIEAARKQLNEIQEQLRLINPFSGEKEIPPQHETLNLDDLTPGKN